LDRKVIEQRVIVLWVGGAPYGDRIPVYSPEYNLANDVAAARVVFGADVELWQVPMSTAGAEFPDTLGRRATLTIGHIIPVARGGADDDNLRAECQRCNDEARDVSSDPPTPGEVLARATSVGGVKEKRALYGWMQAGRRTADGKGRSSTTGHACLTNSGLG
jgi:hypothetical protein